MKGDAIVPGLLSWYILDKKSPVTNEHQEVYGTKTLHRLASTAGYISLSLLAGETVNPQITPCVTDCVLRYTTWNIWDILGTSGVLLAPSLFYHMTPPCKR